MFGAEKDADEADPDALDLSDHVGYVDASSILDEDSGQEYQLPSTDAALAEGMNDT